MLSPIPEIEIESIRTLVESELAFDPVPLIKEGDMVKVTHGPLKGVVGPPGPQGRARAAGAVGGLDRAGGLRRSRRGGREAYTRSEHEAFASLPGLRVHELMKIGSVQLDSPFVVSPMAGMTDTAFRRLVKRQGGCGLVVSEMVSSEGLVRGIDRTLEYAEYTEEERPVSIQIFGGEPAKMAEAARVVEGMGANIVDVNMGCPVPEDREAQRRLQPDARARARGRDHRGHDEGGEDSRHREDAQGVGRRRGERAASWRGVSRTRAPRPSPCTAAPRSRATAASRIGTWWPSVAQTVSIPVFGSGDCIEPEDIVARMKSGVSGVFVGRGVLRNPWILAQARDLMEGRPAREISRRGARTVPARLHAAAARRR